MGQLFCWIFLLWGMSQEEDGDDRKDIWLKFWIYEYLTSVICECHTWVHAWVSCMNWIFVTETSYPPFWISCSIHTWTPSGFATIPCFRALAQFTHALNLALPSSLILALPSSLVFGWRLLPQRLLGRDSFLGKFSPLGEKKKKKLEIFTILV